MLTPIEIQDKSFKSGIGYDKKDVDAFLRDILRNYELLYTKNAELEDKVAVLSEGISHYKSNEKSIQKALVLAQSVSDEIIATANKKAQAIEEKAYAKSDEILLNSKTELNRLNTKIADLTLKFESYKNSCKHFALAQIEMLDNSILSSSITSDISVNNTICNNSPQKINVSENIVEEKTVISDSNTKVSNINNFMDTEQKEVASLDTSSEKIKVSLDATEEKNVAPTKKTKEAKKSKIKSILKKETPVETEADSEDFTVNIDFSDFEDSSSSNEPVKAKEDNILSFDNTFTEVKPADEKPILADEFNIGITFSENTKFNPDDSIRYYEEQVSEKEDKIVKEAGISVSDDEFIFDDIDDDSNSIGIDFDFLNTRK